MRDVWGCPDIFAWKLMDHEFQPFLFFKACVYFRLFLAYALPNSQTGSGQTGICGCRNKAADLHHLLPNVKDKRTKSFEIPTSDRLQNLKGISGEKGHDAILPFTKKKKNFQTSAVLYSFCA